MTLSQDERGTLVAVARLYYENGLTQQEIAKRMGVSRPLVSKMLARARETGIVHIEIRAAAEGDAELLHSFTQKYALSSGLLLPDGVAFWPAIAGYLLAELRYDRNIGVGWGYAVGETVGELAKMAGKKHEGSLFPLIGQEHIPHKGYHPDELVQMWGLACGRRTYALQMPAFPCSEEERRCFEAQPAFSEVSALWQRMDAAVLGVSNYPGVPDEATATRFGETLRKQKAVGSFLSYYYNSRGEFISGDHDFCLHLPLALLRRCGKVIGIGAQMSLAAVSGALATGMFTHFIVTEAQARQLLQA